MDIKQIKENKFCAYYTLSGVFIFFCVEIIPDKVNIALAMFGMEAIPGKRDD